MESVMSQIERVDIESLMLHPENPRLGDVEGIMQSLERFGQVRPLIVQEATGQVIAGNHTWKAAMKLGWTEINIVRVDLDDEEALAFLLADNRLADKGSYDDEALAAALQKLSNLDGIGYSYADLEELTSAIENAGAEVLVTEPEEFKGDYAEPPEVTAARWEGRNEGQRREVVFLLAHEKFEKFRDNVNALKTRYGTDSMADAIYEAVEREAMGS